MRIENTSMLGDWLVVVFGLSACLLVPGCLGSNGDEDPCAGIVCSDRGTCKDNNGVATCSCQPGYRAVGVYCLKDYHLVVLQTNDRHSHWLGQNNCDYDASVLGDGTIGGAARWVPLIKEARLNHQNVLLLDVGDFTMGTMLVVAENRAADLNMLQELDFDAAALGNHEFDWGIQGLLGMLDAANKPRVPLLCANMYFDPSDPRDDPLENLYGKQGEPDKLIYPYIVHEMQGGFKVGIFGLMGINAALAINADPVSFSTSMNEMAETAQAVVDELRNEKQVDVVLLLAHLGLYTDGDTIEGETAELAGLVRGIDLILSGHYHNPAGPAHIPYKGHGGDWTTLSMEAGSYGHYIGQYQLGLDQTGKSATGKLVPITDSLPGDPDIIDRIHLLINDVEKNFLTLFPLLPEEKAFLDGSLFQRLTSADFDLNRHFYENNNLGYLVADAAAEAAEAQLAVIGNSGDLRYSLKRCADGNFSLSDMFNTIPLGIGPDGVLGNPVVVFYQRWSELKMIFELTLADMGWDDNDYMLNLSGLRVQVDTAAPSSSRIVRMTAYDPSDEGDTGTLIYEKGASSEGWHTDRHGLVRVASSLIIAQVLDLFPVIVLRDENGDPIDDLTSRIVKDEYNQEQKLWYLVAKKLAGYIHGVPNQYNDGLSEYDPYWRRVCDINPTSKFGHTCP